MVREAALASKLSLAHVDLGSNANDADYEKAFASTDWTKEDVLLVSDEPEHLSRSRTLVDLRRRSNSNRLPIPRPRRGRRAHGILSGFA